MSVSIRQGSLISEGQDERSEGECLMKRMLLLAALPVFYLGCVKKIPDPATAPDHPANPRAAEGPAPVRSRALFSDASAGATTAPATQPSKPQASQHDH